MIWSLVWRSISLKKIQLSKSEITSNQWSQQLPLTNDTSMIHSDYYCQESFLNWACICVGFEIHSRSLYDVQSFETFTEYLPFSVSSLLYLQIVILEKLWKAFSSWKWIVQSPLVLLKIKPRLFKCWSRKTWEYSYYCTKLPLGTFTPESKDMSRRNVSNCNMLSNCFYFKFLQFTKFQLCTRTNHIGLCITISFETK